MGDRSTVADGIGTTSSNRGSGSHKEPVPDDPGPSQTFHDPFQHLGHDNMDYGNYTTTATKAPVWSLRDVEPPDLGNERPDRTDALDRITSRFYNKTTEREKRGGGYNRLNSHRVGLVPKRLLRTASWDVS